MSLLHSQTWVPTSPARLCDDNTSSAFYGSGEIKSNYTQIMLFIKMCFNGANKNLHYKLLRVLLKRKK